MFPIARIDFHPFLLVLFCWIWYIHVNCRHLKRGDVTFIFEKTRPNAHVHSRMRAFENIDGSDGNFIFWPVRFTSFVCFLWFPFLSNFLLSFLIAFFSNSTCLNCTMKKYTQRRRLRRYSLPNEDFRLTRLYQTEKSSLFFKCNLQTSLLQFYLQTAFSYLPTAALFKFYLQNYTLQILSSNFNLRASFARLFNFNLLKT